MRWRVMGGSGPASGSGGSQLRRDNGHIDAGTRIAPAAAADDLSRADALEKMQAALLAERDLYAHLSTWP
jgi:hypothetical protein